MKKSWITVASLGLFAVTYPASFADNRAPEPKPATVKDTAEAPVQGKPADTKTADAKPAEAKPADPKDAAAADPAVTGAVELAQRYAVLAQETLRQKVVIPPHFKQASAMLMAAMELDPSEPRYPRMLYDAMVQMRDTEGALKAITAFRAIDPNDQLAMVQFIDLKVRLMETADERLDFYKQMLETAAPDPVRSHVAMRASQMAREKGLSGLDDEYLNQALKLNPLNLDALRLKLERLGNDGTPAERVGIMYQMLKSNPVQPQISYRLAREFAAAGLPEDSLRHYTLSVKLATAAGVAMGREFALGYASELYVSSQPQLLQVSKAIMEQLLKADPGDVEALLLRWLCERAGNETEAAAKTQKLIVNAALNRLTTLRGQVGVAGATTRPVDSPEAAVLPDVSEDLKRLKEEKYAALAPAYAQALADLAWYLVYVDKQPAEAAKLLPGLKELLSDTNPVVVRIEGWTYLAQGQFEQAAVKFKAVAEQDDIAQAANLVIWGKDAANKAKAVAAATKHLSENSSGLLAMVLMDIMKDLNLKVAPREDAPTLQKLAKDFPINSWFKIVESPQAFYQLKGEMVGRRIRFAVGDPIMGEVTIRNISDFDLTIGPEGVIKNDLWFDAQLRGLFQQVVTGAAYERISQAMVLKPGQTITMRVRLDQGQLAQALAGNPGPSITFFAQVRTNPRGEGSTPCGYSATFNAITERSGFDITNNAGVQAVLTQLASGTASEKFRALELFAAEIETLKQLQPQTDQSKTLIAGFTEQITKVSDDASPGVATWGTFLTAIHNVGQRGAMMEKLLNDPDPKRKVLGLLIANGLPLEKQKQLLSKTLAEEKSPMVQYYAGAMQEIIEVTVKAATTKPAAGAPATGGGETPTPSPDPKP